MVYLRNWTEYEAAATELYARSPSKVRYCVKFRPKEGSLVLKITDDYKCLKYKTFSSIILNRFESLNLRLLTSMASPIPRAKPVMPATDQDGDIQMDEGVDPRGTASASRGDGADASSRAGGGTPAPGTPASKSAAGKKKKKGKK